MKKEKIAAIALCGTMGLSVCLSGLPARAVSEAFAEEMPAEGAVSETITLSENRSEALTIEAGQTAELDLNGFDMTATLTNNGTLTVKNGKETGAIRITSNVNGVVSAIVNNGTLTFEGADIECTGTGAHTDMRGITNNANATLYYKSGNIEIVSSGAYFGNAIYNASNGTVEEISGGTLSAKLTVKGTQLNSVAVNNFGLIKRISGGEIYSENNGSGGTGNYATGIRNNGGGTITEISGGEIKGYVDNAAGSEVAYAIYNMNNATVGKISGGKLTGETSAKEWAFGIRNEGAINEISGGEIISLISQPTTTTSPNAIALCNDGTVSNVTGGTFYAYSACAPGNTIAIRTRQAGHSITVSGGAYSVNKGTNHILNESPATTTYASGYSLTAASKNGYRYAIPEGGRYEELSAQDSPVMTAKTYNANGVLLAEYTLTGTTTNEIAAIGGEIYGSVDQAIAASEAGDTVVLLKDTESGFTVPAGKDVTVDLNGYEMVGSVVNNGTLALCDSKGTGRLYKRTEANGLDPLIKNYGTLTYGNVSARIDGIGNAPEADGIYNYAGATLTVTGGTLSAISYGTKWSHAIANAGTVKDFAGDFRTVSFSKDTASNIVALSVSGGGIVEKISGGVLYAQSAGKGMAIGVRTQGTGSVQSVSGGTVKAVVNGSGAKAYGIYTQGADGTVTVAGGLVSAVSYTGDAYALKNEGTANVSGGYFKAETAADAACAAALTSGKLNVSGGAFGAGKGEFIGGTAAYEEGVALRKMQSDTVRYAAKESDIIVEQLDGAQFIGVDVFRGGNAVYGYHAYEKDGYYLNGFYASEEDAEMIAKDQLNTLASSATVYAAYEEAPLYYFLGSSVTYGHANNGSSFVNEIANMLNCTCVKEAISGTTLANNGAGSYVARMLNNLDKNAKVERLIVQLSTNDATQNQPRGTVSATKNIEEIDDTTTIGAMEFIIAYAKKTWDCEVTFYTNPYYDNANYKSLVEDLYKVQAKWGVGVLDFYNYRDMDALDQATLSSYMADAIHPNAAGYHWMGEVFSEYLAKLYAQKHDGAKI